jgi:hypothetical protein
VVTADPVQVLADRDAIHDVVMRYARGVDTRDMEMVRACFAPDCDASQWGPELADRDAMIEYIRGVGHFHTTMHMMGNQFVEVDGDRAAVDSYAMLTHHRERGDGTRSKLDGSGNRYVERLERRDGRWVITRRGGEPTWAPTGVTELTTDDLTVQWLLDRAEIHDLMMHYALAVDRRDYDAIRRCFAPGFHAAYGDREFDDLDRLCEFISGVEHFHSTTHFLGTQLIEVAGDDAWAITYSLITHRPREDDPAAEWVSAGRYVDRFRRADGRWRIADRGPTAHRNRPVEPFTPSRPDDHRVAALVDRALVHDVVIRSAIALDDAADGRTHHFANNQLVELDGDAARAETYLYVVERDDDGRPSPWSDCPRRWVDALARGAGGWELVGREELTNRVPDELVLRAGRGA